MENILKNLPARNAKPRKAGITMVMDKGLNAAQAENFLSVAHEYTDVIKLGWNTALVTPNLEEKLAVFRRYDVPFYFGGTMFEAFVVRNQYKDYLSLLKKHRVPFVEVSNGSIDMAQEDKLRYITELAKDHVVFSEVGSKDADKDIPPYKWVEWMKSELEAGAYQVIAEARESGTVGVFQSSGKEKSGLIEEILHHVKPDKILWEAPLKTQQVWFVKLLGANVNLGNISPEEVIPLETIRLGLRGDTFHTFLGK